jgi:Fusaric acid resistance protein-like
MDAAMPARLRKAMHWLSATDWAVGNDSFAESPSRAVASAGAATTPAVFGACFGDPSIGLTASFGAYLIAVSHTVLPAQGRTARRLSTTVLMLSAAALAGAVAGMRPWAFLPLAVLGAAWQALTEIANTGLRLPAAMAVLAMLLSTGNVSGDLSAVPYAAAFSAGAIWQALAQYVVARRVTAPNATPIAEFAVVSSDARAARWFMAVMAALAMAGGFIALTLPVPHSAWLLTAALRVMKPLHGDTLRRLKQRFFGTVAGAIVSAGLLAWQQPALLQAGIFAVMLTIMQFVGTRRYGAWVFCLTVIALDIGLRPYATGWQSAGYRVLLTIGGLALVFLVSVCRPSPGWPWLTASQPWRQIPRR